MKLKSLLSIVLVLFAMSFASAQDDLLNQLDTIKSSKKEIAPAAFKALQVCNMQSTKLPVKGELYILISHRFGDLNKGINNFFGLDNALTKIGGIYGATNWLSLGVSRHTHDKLYELAVKYKLLNQTIGGFPFTIVGYNTADINSELKKNASNPGLEFNNRMAYTSQLIISRKFSESISFEVAPIYVHKNLYDGLLDQENLFLLGAGGRCKLSKRISLNLEYAYKLNVVNDETTRYQNPLAIGIDIETGGHVFQMVFANSQPMNDVTMFSNVERYKYNGSGFYFGFNMYRVF
jgi:Membrane bound beta barrel domain (DUF5777)